MSRKINVTDEDEPVLKGLGFSRAANPFSNKKGTGHPVPQENPPPV
jgi:hypothetical protein